MNITTHQRLSGFIPSNGGPIVSRFNGIQKGGATPAYQAEEPPYQAEEPPYQREPIKYEKISFGGACTQNDQCESFNGHPGYCENKKCVSGDCITDSNCNPNYKCRLVSNNILRICLPQPAPCPGPSPSPAKKEGEFCLPNVNKDCGNQMSCVYDGLNNYICQEPEPTKEIDSVPIAAIILTIISIILLLGTLWFAYVSTTATKQVELPKQVEIPKTVPIS